MCARTDAHLAGGAPKPRFETTSELLVIHYTPSVGIREPLVHGRHEPRGVGPDLVIIHGFSRPTHGLRVVHRIGDCREISTVQVVAPDSSLRDRDSARVASRGGTHGLERGQQVGVGGEDHADVEQSGMPR